MFFMVNDYQNSFILDALGLPSVTGIDDLANILGLSKRIIYLLSKKPDKYYQEKTISKRDGTPRKIFIPSYSLKLIQRWILKEILEKISTSNEATAFIKGKGQGIKNNAEIHKYGLYILEMDIKDFFPSIDSKRVFFLFKNIGYNNMISTILTNLCTYTNQLPQGAVTSPYISNLVCYKLDKRIKGLCNKNDIVYTRYADDLTFSCDNKQILKKSRKIIEDIIKDEGFEVNPKKTRFLSPGSKKVVTGVTVNDKRLKANKLLKKKVRAMLHHSILNGDYVNLNQIRGYISFINYIENGYKNKVITYVSKVADSLTYDENLVKEFNNNKLYKEIPDATFIDPLEEM